MDIKTVIEHIKANGGTPEMITFLEALKTVNTDSVKDFLANNDEGKKIAQSLNDQAVTKGIETFKQKTMPGLIEEAIKQKFPDETEDQKKLRLLAENQTRLEKELKQKDLFNKALQIATEKKLPVKLVNKFLGEDEETTVRNLAELESEFNSTLQALVESKFKEIGRNPNEPVPPGPDLSKMTDDQYFNHRLKENK